MVVLSSNACYYLQNLGYENYLIQENNTFAKACKRFFLNKILNNK